ncbi:MAG: hypothetical protein LBL53_01060 [Endomicrobium sp.]|jgi:riboflavin kinase/FMN adenylyltransferase|nr:hypothetical protein [Endomicrobium sp.]
MFKIKKSIVTIGTFDGVHIGHRFLIKKTVLYAKKNNFKSIIIILEKPFKKVYGLLTTLAEKQEEIKFFCPDEIYIIKVPSDILLYSSNKFLYKFLKDKIAVSKLICSYDFAFGKKREGNIIWLKKKLIKNDMQLNVIEPLKYKSQNISSSYIRLELKKGNIDAVKSMLGKNYYFSGIPFREKGIGIKIGFPTVNLKVNSNKILPIGVYISLISQGTLLYPSITNIGNRISFDRGSDIIPETHILGFNKIWQEKKTKIILLKKVRDERKFSNINDLRKQILKDVAVALHFFHISK